jgi:gliding motility-associated-like protein
MKKLLLKGALLFFSATVFAQGEMNNWYFGVNCGITFNTNPPSYLSGGQINTKEGCSAISDTAGNLLFYSDGEKVWNRNHSVMPNGTGLHGDFSTAQSALIVRAPGSFTQYYIFTAPEVLDVGHGLEYSVVDMTLDGDLGDITSQKNILLLQPSVEMLTGVVHANGSDIWIIGHKWQSSDFYAWLITPSGIGQPIISTSGGIMQSYPGVFDSEGNAIGIMKVSPCGDKIAYVIGYDEYVEMQDFNNTTGVVSNPVYLGVWPGLYPFGIFGVEFSPGCSKLYVNLINPGTVIQYDLNAGSNAAIIASADTVISAPLSTDYFGSLQNGPDGKMYLVKLAYDHLGCIQNPDSTGAGINYIDNYVLCGGNGRYCLPNNITSLYKRVTLPVTSFHIDSVGNCNSLCLSFSDSTTNNPNRWKWYFPGSNIDSSDIKNPSNICYTNNGQYTVTLISCNGAGCDSSSTQITVSLPAQPYVSLGNDTATCNNNAINLNATSGYSAYQWSNSSGVLPETSSTLTITQPDMYIVSISSNGCNNSDTINVSAAPQPIAAFSYIEEKTCEGTRVKFSNASSNATLYHWNFGDGSESNEAEPEHVFENLQDGTILLEAMNAGCLDTETVNHINFGFFELADSIPNVITPDSDGKNDCFHLKNDNGFEYCYSIEIFNRWGNLIYDSLKHGNCWNGKVNNTGPLVDDGVYYYLLMSGTKQIKGTIQVIHGS